MNTRCLLPAILIAIGFSSGCADYGETPQLDEKPKTSNLPLAPAPHVKKTTAQLLVGEWKAINRNGREVPKEWNIVMEFTATGKLHIFVDDKKNPPSVTIGTYKLDGKTIHLERPDSVGEPTRKWDVAIESISDDTLVFGGDGKERIIFRHLQADENPKAVTRPQAPAPHAKKTTAQLLVGTWKATERNGQAVPKEWTLAFEFTAEGKVHIFIDDKKNPPSATIGTYKLDGKSIHLERPEAANQSARKWDITIESITSDSLILVHGSEREILQRLPSK